MGTLLQVYQPVAQAEVGGIKKFSEPISDRQVRQMFAHLDFKLSPKNFCTTRGSVLILYPFFLVSFPPHFAHDVENSSGAGLYSTPSNGLRALGGLIPDLDC